MLLMSWLQGGWGGNSTLFFASAQTLISSWVVWSPQQSWWDENLAGDTTILQEICHRGHSLLSHHISAGRTWTAVHASLVYNVMRVKQGVVLPVGLCAGLYGQPTLSVHLIINWCEISTPLANIEVKAFPLVLMKDMAEQSSLWSPIAASFTSVPRKLSHSSWPRWLWTAQCVHHGMSPELLLVETPGGGQQAGPALHGGPSHVTTWPFALHEPGEKWLISFHLAQAHGSICVCLGKLWTGLAWNQGAWRRWRNTKQNVIQ